MTTVHAMTLSLLGFALALGACSGSGDGSTGDAGTTTTEGGTVVAAGAEDIVIDEFSSVGASEWLEIANKGTSAFDLGSYAIADSDKTTGQPKTDDAMRFPAGTTIAAGARIVILTSKKDQAVGPHDKAACLANGPATCFYAAFGISAANGELVHFLAPDDTVISTTGYPRSVTVDPATDKTACRIPDFTGSFVLCSPTPGAVNVAP